MAVLSQYENGDRVSYTVLSILININKCSTYCNMWLFKIIKLNSLLGFDCGGVRLKMRVYPTILREGLVWTSKFV